MTPITPVCAARPRRGRTAFSEDAIIAAMERQLWRMSRDIGAEFGVSQ